MDPIIELGRVYEDELTGFRGIATALCSYLTGCDQVGLLGQSVDGAKPVYQWVDVPRVVQVSGRGALVIRVLERVDRSDPGGPGPHPPSRHP